MRVELLEAATGYGVSLALSAGGHARVDEWRAWLVWVKELLERACARSTALQETFKVQACPSEATLWPVEYLDLLANYEDGGAEAVTGLTDDWAALWIEQRERLAERARAVEAIGGKPLGEVEGEEYGEAVALLSALEDSLTLSLSMNESNRRLRSSAEEIYDLLVAARKQRVWDALVDIEV